MKARQRLPTVSPRSAARRVASVVAILAIATMAAGSRPAVGATFEATSVTESRIERPMVDVGFLAPVPGADIPRLLVIDAEAPTPGVVRMAILARDRFWAETTSAWIVLRPGDVGGVRPARALSPPWMLSVDADAVVVIANGLIEDASYLTRVDIVDGADGAGLAQGPTVRLPFRIDDAGIADTRGDGSAPSLIVASARTERGDPTCQGSTVRAIDADTLATEAVIDLPGLRLAGGVLGPFDGSTGDDLFAYAYPNCPAGPDRPGAARLVGVRLSDGAITFDESIATDLGFLGSPLRSPRPSHATDGLVARRPGLSLMTWDDHWTTWFLAGQSSQPLAVVGPTEGRQDAGVIWIDTASSQPSISMSVLAGDAVTQHSLLRDELAPARWEQLTQSIAADTAAGTPSVAFAARILVDDCPDIFVTGAIVSCDAETPRNGAAWTATRPLAIEGAGIDRRLLVAAGIEWPERGLPRAPSPAATGVVGWWRHGPSAPFVLGEARAVDATYFREFPVPRATVDRTAGPARTVDLPGFTGARLFVRVGTASDAADGAAEPVEDTALGVLRAAAGRGERLVVTRIGVAPGLEAGRDGGFARLDLGVQGGPDGPWLVSVVPINDWGEVGRAASGIVARDVAAPYLDVALPIVSPVWPMETDLSGVAEPGTTVRIDGGEVIDLDRRGRFVIRTTLAPWPQTFRVTATDIAGNITTREISVVGGVDYRQIPIEAMVAALLLIAAVVSGVIGSRRPRTAGAAVGPVDDEAWRTADGPWLDDPGGPEIQDLPSGSGVDRR